MQEKLDDLVEQQNRNSVKFNNPKCKIMPLKTNHQNFCCRKGIHEPEEGGMNELIDHRMFMSSLCYVAMKTANDAPKCT